MNSIRRRAAHPRHRCHLREPHADLHEGGRAIPKAGRACLAPRLPRCRHDCCAPTRQSPASAPHAPQTSGSRRPARVRGPGSGKPGWVFRRKSSSVIVVCGCHPERRISFGNAKLIRSRRTPAISNFPLAQGIFDRREKIPSNRPTHYRVGILRVRNKFACEFIAPLRMTETLRPQQNSTPSTGTRLLTCRP